MWLKGRLTEFLMQPLIGWPSIRLLKRTKFAGRKIKNPEEWSSKIVNQTLERIISGGKDQLRTTSKEHQKNKTKSIDKRTIFLQYIGNFTQNFASKLKKLCEMQVVFTTRKLRSCLPTLKSSFFRDLKSHVVYEIKCNWCGSIYACRTVEKLMIIEAIYISKLKPELNTRDEYRGRELTLKY